MFTLTVKLAEHTTFCHWKKFWCRLDSNFLLTHLPPFQFQLQTFLWTSPPHVLYNIYFRKTPNATTWFDADWIQKFLLVSLHPEKIQVIGRKLTKVYKNILRDNKCLTAIGAGDIGIMQYFNIQEYFFSSSNCWSWRERQSKNICYLSIMLTYLFVCRWLTEGSDVL